MSADVLMTGPGRDLNPRDRIVDSRYNRDVIAQQIDTSFQIGESEWVLDTLQGIDWIGFFTAKEVDINGIAAALTRQAQAIPNVHVEKASGFQVGRTLQMSMDILIEGERFQLSIVANTSTPMHGNNAVYAPVSLQWGLSGSVIP